MKRKGMERINLYLTPQQMKAFRALSADTGLTVAELLRRAVDDYLDRDRPKRK